MIHTFGEVKSSRMWADEERRFLHLSCFRVARSGEVVLDVGGRAAHNPPERVFEFTILVVQFQ